MTADQIAVLAPIDGAAGRASQPVRAGVGAAGEGEDGSESGTEAEPETEPEAASEAEYLRIIDALSARGAEAVILGCTEISMLVKQSDTNTGLLDTTAIHAAKAVEYATEQAR